MKKVKKRIAVFALFALTMTAAFSTVPDIAMVGETGYASLADALEAWTDGTTLKLMADVTVDSTINIGFDETSSTGERYTFDLNNHGIMFTGNEGSVFKIWEGMSLTVNDSAATKTERYITLNDEGRGISVSDSGAESGTCIKVTGGYITGGNASDGGGVTTSYNSRGFTMNGGTIVGNRAAYGGGIYSEMGGIRIKGNSKIINNTADFGGGIYIYSGSLGVEGSVQITGNKNDDANDNVYLACPVGYEITIDLSGPLNADARIGVGVSNDHSKVITDGLYGDKEYANGIVTNFISDDPSYTIVLNSLGEAVLTPFFVTVTANVDPSHRGVYYATYYDSSKNYVADADTEVFYATGNANGKLTLVKVNDRIIKAGEGVILKSSSSTIILSETTLSVSYDSIFTGSDSVTTVTDKLVLGCGEKGVLFYRYSGSVLAHKAWVSE